MISPSHARTVADGNVYLFLPDMCPVGGVHVTLAGARAVANQLGIDAAPAQTVRAPRQSAVR